jgi:NitT/TauT family transport system substrate-binding protein
MVILPGPWSAALLAVLCGLMIAPASALAAELGTLRVGVLEFGTVNWELDVIEHNELDRKHGFDLEVQGYGSGEATNVALQGGAVDAIVDDWLWVSRQRAVGKNLVFIPFSTTIGALMVPSDAGIETVEDLAGRKLGVAVGPLDKSWLLIQGYAREKFGMDLADAVEPAFGAPPLLNQKALDGELDGGALNYWHFAARLEARGFEQLIGADEAAKELGIESDVPQLGYVLDEGFADQNEALVLAFVAASREAKELLRTSEAEWQRIRPLTRAEDDATFEILKRRFREGIPSSFGPDEQADAARLYGILRGLGGQKLVGSAEELAPGTFWSKLATY